jgi:hypothetical protein
LVHELICAKVVTRDGVEGVLNAWPPAYAAPLISAMLDACDGAEGVLRCETSSLHPQQYPLAGKVHGIKLNEPILRLILRRPRKRHSRTLGFDDVIRDLWFSGVAFEGPNAEGVDLNLDVGILFDISGCTCWGASR